MNIVVSTLESVIRFTHSHFKQPIVVDQSDIDEIRARCRLSDHMFDFSHALAQEITPLSDKSAHKIAAMVADEAAVDEDSPILWHGVSFLRNYVPMTQGWLSHLLPPNQPKWQTDRIYAVVKNCPHVESIYLKLLGIPYERAKMSAAQLLAITLFAATSLKNSVAYYKRTQYGLPRSLQWDSKREVFYILSKSFAPIDDTSYKRVTHAIGISMLATLPGQNAAQLVNKDSIKDIDLVKREVDLCTELSNPEREGIWPIHTSASYTKARNNVQKISVIAPLATANLFVYLQTHKVTPQFMASIFYQICLGVQVLHEKDIIHGDLKATNVLISGKKVGLCDLGIYHKLGNKKFFSYLDEGFYGSIFPTAPELLTQNVQNCDLKKVEMWALGYTLYHCLTKMNFSWDDELCALFDKKPADKNRILSKMKSEIERLRKNFTQANRRDLEATLFLFICDLMAYEPAKRLTIQQACAYLKPLAT